LAEHLDGDDHPRLDDTVVRRGLADGRAVEQRGELADAGLHLALLLLGGVVAAVLTKVPLETGGLDLVRNVGAAIAGEVGELLLEAVVGLLGQERRIGLGHLYSLGVTGSPVGALKNGGPGRCAAGATQTLKSAGIRTQSKPQNV